MQKLAAANEPLRTKCCVVEQGAAGPRSVPLTKGCCSLINTGAQARDSLFDDAFKRVEEEISPICLAVLYPTTLRQIDTPAKLKRSLSQSTKKFNHPAASALKLMARGCS